MRLRMLTSRASEAYASRAAHYAERTHVTCLTHNGVADSDRSSSSSDPGRGD